MAARPRGGQFHRRRAGGGQKHRLCGRVRLRGGCGEKVKHGGGGLLLGWGNGAGLWRGAIAPDNGIGARGEMQPVRLAHDGGLGAAHGPPDCRSGQEWLRLRPQLPQPCDHRRVPVHIAAGGHYAARTSLTAAAWPASAAARDVYRSW
jgi:hypothetical protein